MFIGGMLPHKVSSSSASAGSMWGMKRSPRLCLVAGTIHYHIMIDSRLFLGLRKSPSIVGSFRRRRKNVPTKKQSTQKPAPPGPTPKTAAQPLPAKAPPCPVAVHEIVPDGTPGDYRFLSVNQAFGRLVGLQEQELIGRTVQEALPATGSARIEAYGRVALRGEPALLEEDDPVKDRRYQVTVFRPALDKLACVFVDITGPSTL